MRVATQKSRISSCIGTDTIAECHFGSGQFNIEVFGDEDNPTSQGFTQDPSGKAFWGDNIGLDNRVIVQFADGQLTFTNTHIGTLNALAYGQGDDVWNDSGGAEANNDILAAASTNPSEKLPQTGPTSIGDTFYEAALWSARDSPDPTPGSAPGATVKELFATWVNPDGTAQQAFFTRPKIIIKARVRRHSG